VPAVSSLPPVLDGRSFATVAEAAGVLRIDARTVRRAITEGLIPATKTGREYCVTNDGSRYSINVTLLSGNLKGITGTFEIPPPLLPPWSTARACSGSVPSATPSAPATVTAPSPSNTLDTTTINGTQVVTNSNGYTLYWFAPDTPTTAKCTGSCAAYWPPVPGPVTAGSSGVTGTLGTITRSDGSTQATYDGHPLYTYAGDSAPGQNKGNGLNVSGGLWYEMTVST
jgi:excisionase family DNA binding protein